MGRFFYGVNFGGSNPCENSFAELQLKRAV